MKKPHSLALVFSCAFICGFNYLHSYGRPRRDRADTSALLRPVWGIRSFRPIARRADSGAGQESVGYPEDYGQDQL